MKSGSRSENAPNPVDVRRHLLKWFSRNRKVYPWRIKPTPYSVWISEVMLQQTVTTAVVPYFLRWMDRFPSVRALARASEAQVLRAWEGLGYYSRARNLHRSAQIIVSEYNGHLPSAYTDLLRLPGIGTYTAAAIMSIAFNEPYPVIDANVRRVVGRLLARKKAENITETEIGSFLLKSISTRRPGQFNEAMMELGQLLCRIKNPACGECPLETICRANQHGIVTHVGRVANREVVGKDSWLLLIRRGAKFALMKSRSGRFSQMWGFPRLAKTAGDDSLDMWMNTHLGRSAKIVNQLDSIVHYYTRYRDRLWPIVIRTTAASPLKSELEWFTLDDIAELPLPRVDRTILERLVMPSPSEIGLKNET